MHFYVHRRNKNLNVNLYAVPRRSISNIRVVRCFKTDGLAEFKRARGEDYASSTAMAPNHSQRSKTLLDRSSKPMDGMNDFERQLQEFFAEVKSMLKLGNKDDAITLLQANYEAVKEQIDAGVKDMEQAAILDIIALGYMGLGDFVLVESLLDMMNEIVCSVKNSEPLLDSLLMHMGSMYTALGKFDNAMLVYRRGLEILENLYGKDSPFLVIPLLGIGKVFGAIGRATKAVEIYKRALNILETSRGADSEDVVLPLFNLGNLLIKEGRASDAEIYFKRISSIYMKIYGEHDGRVGMAMCSLAHALCAKGNVDEAISSYRNGLKVIKDSKYMALDDDIMEKMRIDLAELLHVAGRENEGRELLEECLLVSEKYEGNEHPSTVTHLLNLATSYSRSKNFVEAERLLRTSLRIITKSMGPEDPSITIPMLHLAITLYHMKQFEEAEYLALEAVHIREEAFGKESLPVGEALDCLVSIQTRIGTDDSKILMLLKRVLSIQEKELGYESEDAMITLKKVVFYLDKLGRKDEKLPLQRRLSMYRTKHKQSVRW
ncbi:PREDICTED: nephrocystin-3 isoform X2 [Nelumbo nucifera]|nr:PREDICTED: nephrocystin-3 isoform X2 [Nelumbo nucifera]XP_010267555.1 PREDICTED: nephrocystin-3 isoform X2 [Nelumbo nucifera]